MVEVKKTRSGITVRIIDGLHPWDVEEYFLEDLMGHGTIKFRGVSCSETHDGLLLSPGDHQLVIRPNINGRLIYGGDILLRKDGNAGRSRIDVVGTNGSRSRVA